MMTIHACITSSFQVFCSYLINVMTPHLCMHYTLYHSKVICAIIANQCLLKDSMYLELTDY